MQKAKAIAKDDVKGKDLLQTTLTYIMCSQKSRSQARLCAVNGSLDKYVCHSMRMQYYSATSPYHYTYRKDIIHYNGDIPERQDTTWLGNRIDTETLDSLISRLKPFDAELLRLYSMPDFSYKATAEAIGVSETVLYKSVQKSIKLLSNALTRRQGKGQTP